MHSILSKTLKNAFLAFSVSMCAGLEIQTFPTSGASLPQISCMIADKSHNPAAPQFPVRRAGVALLPFFTQI